MFPTPYLHSFQRQLADSSLSWNVCFAIRLEVCPQYREPSKSASRRVAALGDQVDLINGFFSPDPPKTFSLRYIAQPDPAGSWSGRLDVALLGKLQSATAEGGAKQAVSLCHETAAHLGSFLPDHGWKICGSKTDFDTVYEPFPWEKAYSLEIRRRETRINLESVRPRPSLGRGRTSELTSSKSDGTVYLVHQFLPRSRTQERLARRLLLHGRPVMLSVSLSPVWLQPGEESAIGEEILKCESFLQGESMPARGAVVSNVASRMRAAALCEYQTQQLSRLQDAPFLLRVSLVSPEPLPRSLAEAVGVEMTGPIGGEVPEDSRAEPHLERGGYDIVVPKDDEEAARLRNNTELLEFEPWGGSLASPALWRLRYLTDAWEATSAFRFPMASEDGLVGMDLRTSRIRPLPREVAELPRFADKVRLLELGENRYMGLSQKVYLSEPDRRQHVYVVGQTGTGKTMLLKSMILDDISAGCGVAVVDPHGDLFRELLAAVPRSRWDDVVVLDPTDSEFPVGFNLLEAPQEEERHFIVREMRGIVTRLLTDEYEHQTSQFAGPLFYQHMQMNMLLAMSNPDDPGTLLEFYEIFHHVDYWKRWLPLRWDDPQLKRWVTRNLPAVNYTSRSGPGEVTLGEYLSSKFDDYVFDPRLRRIFGQKRSTINLREIMDDGKILLVNLAKGELTEANARFLGMVLMAKLQAAALSRVSLPVHRRKTFYLYVDEFQSLATENFVSMLSEARKFGLSLVLANQFLSQIRDDRIIRSVFGNVGTLIAFRVGSADAELLESQFTPAFDSADLRNLPNWNACVKTTVRGQVAAPFSVQTVLPAAVGSEEAADEIRSRSRKAYGRPRAEVDEILRASVEVKSPDS